MREPPASRSKVNFPNRHVSIFFFSFLFPLPPLPPPLSFILVSLSVLVFLISSLLTSILLYTYYQRGERIPANRLEIIQIVVYEMNYSIISRRSGRHAPRHTEREPRLSSVSLQIYALTEFWSRWNSRKLLFLATIVVLVHFYEKVSLPCSGTVFRIK